MNPSDEKYFFDLAMKVITRQSSESEQAELAEWLARQPELQAEFDQLRADADILREVSPLIEASDAVIGELPGYARERLQQHVRQKILIPQRGTSATVTPPETVRRWRWQWVAGVASVALVMGLTILGLRNNGLFSSWLDLADPSSQNVDGQSPLGLPPFECEVAFVTNAPVTLDAENKQQQIVRTLFRGKTLSFPGMDDPGLKAWEANFPLSVSRTVVKLIYDRAGEKLYVIGHCNGKGFKNTFEVKDHNPQGAFAEAGKFIYLKITLLRAN